MSPWTYLRSTYLRSTYLRSTYLRSTYLRGTYLRRTLYGVIIFGLLFILFILPIIFRRHSPRMLVTVSTINEFRKQQNLDSRRLNRIPRIIHQTWKTKDVPSYWTRAVDSVRQLNANKFEYHLWTDIDMHEFVRQKEPYIYNHTFLAYPHDIQRVDAFRYIVLFHLGGIYIDMDNGCAQSFDSLLNMLETIDERPKHLAAFPRTSPIGISNGFMISTKRHPLFKILISRLSLFNNNYLIDYLTVMLSTGPSFLSINEFYFDTESTESAVRILDEAVYSSVYTWHTPGNSWHGQDARIILYIYHSLGKSTPTILYHFLFVISLITFIILFLFYRRLFRSMRIKS